MNLGLAGRRFVVSSGSRRIGRAVAEQLVAEGARVLLVADDAVVREAADLGDATFGLAADLSTREGVDEVVSSAAIVLGGLDGVLVDVASPPLGNALELHEAEWQRAFDFLLAHPLRLLRELVPQMDDGGSILFATSASAIRSVRGMATWSTLCPAVSALVKVLAYELAPAIRVNGLAHGSIDLGDAPSLEERAAKVEIAVDEQGTRMAASIPLGGHGEPAELGRVAAFLLSPAASYVTGTTVLVDGGAVVTVP